MTTYAKVTNTITASNADLLSGLTAYYGMAANANDSLGDYNGTAYSGAVLAVGKIGSGYTFDGTNSYIEAAMTSNPITGGTFSVSAWVQPDTEDTGTHAIVSRWDETALGRQFICALDSANAYFGIVESDTSNILYQPTISLGSGTWKHVVYMADGTNLEVYVNAIRQGTGLSYDGTLQTPGSTSFHFGKLRIQDNIWNYDGQLDEIGIWNRALTTTEITNLYNSGSGRTYPLTFTDSVSTTYRDFNNITVIDNISDYNNVGVFSMNFDNENGDNKDRFNVGDEISFYVDKSTNPPTTKIFGGYISSVDSVGIGLKESLIIAGDDYTATLRDATLEPTVYNNLDAGSIVKSIIADYTTGITTGSVDDTGNTINHISFRHMPVFDAIKQIAEETNYYFFVDTSKNLNFKPKGGVSAGVTLGSANVRVAKFGINDQDLYNKIWVYGDRSLLAPETITETSDGVGSVISLANKPHNIKVQDSGTNVAKGGIFEMNVNPGSDIIWLSDFDAKEIIWTSGNVPASGAISTINYDRSAPIVKFAEDRVSQDIYGIKSKVIVDKNIKNPLQARDLVKTTLANHSQPTIQGTLGLRDVSLLTPGNTVTVNLPNHNIDNQTQELLNVTYNLNNNNLAKDEVMTVITNKKIKNINDTLKQMMLDIKKLQASDFEEADVITRLEQGTGSEGLKVSSWQVWSQNIGNSFILGHSVNGILGSPALGVNGSQIFLGDYKAGSVLQTSGAD